MAGVTANQTATLVPYLPGLAVDWLVDTPDELWREIEGSLVFVDVSGFTALSERLAARGRVGAEEITEVIGTCFAELLTAAYRLDGSLVKFGGDALLILFGGANHPFRAVQAAVHMRQALRSLGRIETSRGSVRLRMSVGVHSGTILCCLVGGSHRELVLTGPAATATVDMEGEAGPGEIVVSPATAAGIGTRWALTPRGPGFLLRAAAPRVRDRRRDPSGAPGRRRGRGAGRAARALA